MTTETKRNLRTAIGVAVWVAMLAISQESAANTFTDHHGAARSAAKSRDVERCDLIQAPSHC